MNDDETALSEILAVILAVWMLFIFWVADLLNKSISWLVNGLLDILDWYSKR